MRIGRAAAIAGGLLGTFVVVLGSIPATRARTDRLVVLTVVLYLGFVARRRLGVGVRPEVDRDPPHDPLGPPDEPDVRLARLDAALALAAGSGEHYARVTRPALRHLVADRLRMRTGIDVTADPAGARRVMGEELWLLFATPPEHVGPAPGPLGLRDLVERAERL